MSFDQWWDILLQLRKTVQHESTPSAGYHVHAGSGKVNPIDPENPARKKPGDYIIRLETQAEPEDDTDFWVNTSWQVLTLNRELPADLNHFLKIYMPFCFAPAFAKKYKRPLTVAHFAQSLDGKIATLSGQSKWIGGEENLKHAHRMRALCDAVLIGKNTLNTDQPRLTVRRVPGENPVRIVVGQGGLNVNSLMESSPDPVWIVGSEMPDTEADNPVFVQVPCRENVMGGKDILSCLFDRGITSIYVEGGPHTTSGFLAQNILDMLQLHIAPLLFGSGKSNIVLPEIREVHDAVTFSHYDFHPMGTGMMFVGYLDQNQPDV